MKNIKKTISAIMAAAVIFGTAATSVSAFDPPAEGTYIGWEHTSGGWTYTFTDYDELYCKIDGVLYDFNEYICTGRHNGFISFGKTKMYYVDGLPYTGWTKNKKGERKYYLDGYPAKGEMPIGKNIYTFDENGILTEKKSAVFIAVPDGKVCEGDKTINVTVKLLGEGVYEMVPPSKLERLNGYGEWVDCGREGVEYITCDCLYTFDSEGDFWGEKNLEAKTSLDPEEYIGAKLTAGYYRIMLGAYGIESDSVAVYAVFEVLPPAEVKMSEDIYTADKDADAEVRAYVTVNSEKLSDKDITVRVEKKTSLGWETAVKEFKLDKSVSCDTESADGTVSVDFSLPPENGYYRTVAEIDGREYEAAFRVEVSDRKK